MTNPSLFWGTVCFIGACLCYVGAEYSTWPAWAKVGLTLLGIWLGIAALIIGVFYGLNLYNSWLEKNQAIRSRTPLWALANALHGLSPAAQIRLLREFGELDAFWKIRPGPKSIFVIGKHEIPEDFMNSWAEAALKFAEEQPRHIVPINRWNDSLKRDWARALTRAAVSRDPPMAIWSRGNESARLLDSYEIEDVLVYFGYADPRQEI